MNPLTKHTLIRMRDALRADTLGAMGRDSQYCAYFATGRTCIIGHVIPEKIREYMEMNKLNEDTDFGSLLQHLETYTAFRLDLEIGISHSQGVILQAWHDNVYAGQALAKPVALFDELLTDLIDNGGRLWHPTRDNTIPAIF